MQLLKHLPETVTKLLEWETNFNNKMQNNNILHLDLLPKQQLSPKEFESMNFGIVTADDTHQKIIVKLTEVHSFRLWWIPEVLTQASHAMNDLQFIEFMYQKHEFLRVANKQDQCVGLYVYKKLHFL